MVYTKSGYASINVKPAAGGRGGGGEGWRQGDLIDRFGPGVGHLHYLALSCCPGVRIFEFLFVPVVGQYLTPISLRETGTECSSRVVHTRYNWQSWRSCKMRRRLLFCASNNY